jgi:tRNA threonylcarbamoyladenosine biosynthesis protein TsaB
MRILGFDTATPATAVAVCEIEPGQPPRFSREVNMRPSAGERPGHAHDLLPAVSDLLRDSWQVDRIAVGIGPGTFTGLRIGVATAQGLGRSLGVPVVPVSTLHALGMNMIDASPGVLLALIDARRGEAFAAGWPAGGDLLEPPALPAPSVWTPAQLEAHVDELRRRSGTVSAIGDGALKFRGLLERSGVLVEPDDHPVHRVMALSHCWLAAGLEPPEIDSIQPAYLRLPDAEIARRR